MTKSCDTCHQSFQALTPYEMACPSCNAPLIAALRARAELAVELGRTPTTDELRAQARAGRVRELTQELLAQLS